MLALMTQRIGAQTLLLAYLLALPASGQAQEADRMLLEAGHRRRQQQHHLPGALRRHRGALRRPARCPLPFPSGLSPAEDFALEFYSLRRRQLRPVLQPPDRVQRPRRALRARRRPLPRERPQPRRALHRHPRLHRDQLRRLRDDRHAVLPPHPQGRSRRRGRLHPRATWSDLRPRPSPARRGRVDVRAARGGPVQQSHGPSTTTCSRLKERTSCRPTKKCTTACAFQAA